MNMPTHRPTRPEAIFIFKQFPVAAVLPVHITHSDGDHSDENQHLNLLVSRYFGALRLSDFGCGFV